MSFLSEQLETTLTILTAYMRLLMNMFNRLRIKNHNSSPASVVVKTTNTDVSQVNVLRQSFNTNGFSCIREINRW